MIYSRFKLIKISIICVIAFCLNCSFFTLFPKVYADVEDVFNDNYYEEGSFVSIDKANLNNVYCSAKSMALIDARNGRVLLGKNCDEKLAMASTTKIVTALTVLNHCDDLDREVLVSDKAIGIYGTSIYLRKGEKLTVRELLYGLMLSSGNDAAVALAIHTAGSIEEFTSLMKQTAIDCGATSSNFANPHGLDEEGHYTTAVDLARITAKALENEDFKTIVTTKNTTIKGQKEGELRYLKNKNKLLTKLDGCIGVKTGFTNNAGRCLVSAVEKDDVRLVCVVLNCGPMFEESYDILTFGLENYKNVCLLEPYKFISNVPVVNGEKEFCKVYTKNEFNFVLNSYETANIKYIYDIPATLEADINKDDIIGEVRIYLDNDLIFSEKIYTMESVKSLNLSKKFEDILDEWF